MACNIVNTFIHIFILSWLIIFFIIFYNLNYGSITIAAIVRDGYTLVLLDDLLWVIRYETFQHRDFRRC